MPQEGKARAVGITLIHDTGSEFYLTATRHVSVTRITLLQSLLLLFFFHDTVRGFYFTDMAHVDVTKILFFHSLFFFFFTIHRDISQQLVKSNRKGGLTLLTIYKSWAKPGASDSTPKNAACGA